VNLALSQMADIPGLSCELWIAGPLDHAKVVQWSHHWQLPIVAQQGDDLGARMSHAIQTCLDESGRVLVVGTDCPDMTSGYVQQAVTALHNHDLVLGPAEDGGYGLIGLRKPAPSLFENMRWGTDTVLQVTLDRALRIGLSYELLTTIWDVDDAVDWDRFRASRSS
ncbi:MAG: TIGR04282 family arsenosugar biosynthesis glycosyltransferase, partial [Gammaproteobacteria bacterium]|nr:TIGR04282 family arsenosugar biosynthesis glycosyltransferase [Gammaproteobacteria bacterium]